MLSSAPGRARAACDSRSCTHFGPMKSKLTKTRLRSLWQQRPKELVEIWDQQVPGLCLRAQPTRLTWTVRYRRHGRYRRQKLGRYPHMSLADARLEAIRVQRSIDRGENPQLDGATVEQLVRVYLAERASKKRSGYKDRQHLERDVLPQIGGALADDITAADLHELVSAVAERAPVGANRLLSILQACWGHGVVRGLVVANVAADVPRPTQEQPRERVLSDDELRALVPLFRTKGAPGAVLELALLTGQRIGCFLGDGGMRWDEVEGNWWTIPRHRMKSRATSHDHRVYLSAQSLRVLDRMRGDGPVVFVGQKGSLVEVRRRMFDPAGVTGWSPRDLRPTAATRMRRLGVAKDVVSAILDHSEAGITGRHYLDPSAYDGAISEALQALGDHLASVVSQDAGSG